MRKIPKEVWIGLFATMALTLMFIGINFLKGDDIFTGRNTYYSLLDDVKGLKAAAPVLYKGIKTGTVTEVELLPERNAVLVTVEVSKRVSLPMGTRLRLVSTDLFDTKALQIEIGQEAGRNYRHRDTLPAEIAPSLIENLVGDLTPLKDKVEISLSNLNRILEAVEEAKIRHSLAQLDEGSSNLNELIRDSRGPIQKTLSELSRLSEDLRQDQPLLKASIQNFKTFSDSLSHLQLKQTVNQAALALSSTRQLMERIQSDQGTLGKLMKDSSLYYNLQQSTLSLNLLLTDLRQNPGRYVQVSVFGRKDKESKKSLNSDKNK
ncbi:MAG: MCE family protein [Sphingobacteriia bacterium]|jgi:phospholipid/cholesterol/gamma-HCH transport system substrate-binding protein|nr:MCE family protein [Sphingobacteriia bacterium]NDC72183.1 MCE family protein [Sphingobacteriia bacterium]